MMSPFLYSQILDECDKVALDYAMGLSKTAFMKKSFDDFGLYSTGFL